MQTRRSRKTRDPNALIDDIFKCILAGTGVHFLALGVQILITDSCWILREHDDCLLVNRSSRSFPRVIGPRMTALIRKAGNRKRKRTNAAAAAGPAKRRKRTAGTVTQ